MGHFYQAKVKRANAEVGDEVTGYQEGTTDGRKKEPQMEERAAQGAGRSEPRWGLSHWAALVPVLHLLAGLPGSRRD